MQSWKVNALMVAMGAASLIPLMIALPLWSRLKFVSVPPWRRALSTAGLTLATFASLVLPLWLYVISRSGTRENASRLVGIALEAVVAGLATAIPAMLLLCFSRDKIRWLGLTSCLLTIALFALSLSGF